MTQYNGNHLVAESFGKLAAKLAGTVNALNNDMSEASAQATPVTVTEAAPGMSTYSVTLTGKNADMLGGMLNMMMGAVDLVRNPIQEQRGFAPVASREVSFNLADSKASAVVSGLEAMHLALLKDDNLPRDMKASLTAAAGITHRDAGSSARPVLKLQGDTLVAGVELVTSNAKAVEAIKKSTGIQGEEVMGGTRILLASLEEVIAAENAFRLHTRSPQTHRR